MSAGEGSFGVSNWYPAHGENLIAPSDRQAFAALSPAGKVFQVLGEDAEWVIARYGPHTFRVSPEVLKPVRAPIFGIGQTVLAKEKQGVVVDIVWHFKDAAPIYFLALDGKRSSRRYSESELRRLQSV